MDSSILIKRTAVAQQKMIAAAKAIGKTLGVMNEVDALEAVKSRDPQLLALFQREAVGRLLEAIAINLGVEDPESDPGDEQPVDTPDEGLPDDASQDEGQEPGVLSEGEPGDASQDEGAEAQGEDAQRG